MAPPVSAEFPEKLVFEISTALPSAIAPPSLSAVFALSLAIRYNDQFAFCFLIDRPAFKDGRIAAKT